MGLNVLLLFSSSLQFTKTQVHSQAGSVVLQTDKFFTVKSPNQVKSGSVYSHYDCPLVR